MQGYCGVYKWTILKRTSPEVECLHPTSSRREMCTSSVSNVIYHKFSHGAAFYTLNGENVNVMLELCFSYSLFVFILLWKSFYGFSCWWERHRGRVVRAARLWCRKSPYRVNSRLGCAMRRLETSLCQPSRKWKGKERQQKERDGLRLSWAVPKIQWDSNPHCPYGY